MVDQRGSGRADRRNPLGHPEGAPWSWTWRRVLRTIQQTWGTPWGTPKGHLDIGPGGECFAPNHHFWKSSWSILGQLGALPLVEGEGCEALTSRCHWVTCHLVIWSPSHTITWSPVHLVTKSPGDPVTWSPGITWISWCPTGDRPKFMAISFDWKSSRIVPNHLGSLRSIPRYFQASSEWS